MISKLIGSAGFLSSGGTIGGDLTIDGDLTVSGGGSTFAYNEVVTGDMIINRDASGNSAENGVGLYVDFDRTVASSGTAAHNDIGINLDVNSASLGTSSVIGMDIDVVGATSGTSTATGLTVDVGSADTNYAALFNGGNVGINESVPLGVLHVKSADSGISTLDSGGDELVVEGSGSAGISILAGASSTAGLYFPDSGDANRGFLRYDHNTDAMTIRTNNADAVTVDSAAKVWCKELDVSSASHAYATIDSSATGTATWLVHSMGGANKWMAGMEGGGTEYRIYDNSDSSVAVHVAAGGSSWVNDSDERMKKEILPMEDRLSDLMKIKVRRFKWKKNDKEDFGFVAQELESCVPEAVDVGSDEVYSKEEADDNPTATEGELKNPYGVSRELLIPMMIKSIQELTAKVEELEAKLK